MSELSEEVGKRIMRLLGNIFKLFIILFFLRIVIDLFNPYIKFGIVGYLVTGEMVLNLLSLVLIIYYGHSILTDGKFLLDVTSRALVVKFGVVETPKMIAYDLIYLIVLFLGGAAIIPVVGSIPEVGSLLARVITLVFIGVGFLVVYHLMRCTFSLMRSRIDLAVETISRRLEKAATTEKPKETDEG